MIFMLAAIFFHVLTLASMDFNSLLMLPGSSVASKSDGVVHVGIGHCLHSGLCTGQFLVWCITVARECVNLIV